MWNLILFLKRISAGSILSLLLVACTPFATKIVTSTKDLIIEKDSSATLVPTHPIKFQAKSPPPKKRLLFFNIRHDDVWDRVRHDFRLDHQPDNPRVQAHIRWFQKHPDYVERVMQRASPYIFLIVEELDRRNMPKEVALLPMIESAFNPTAYSPAHASGLWQMIPGTARVYGIQMNNYYDGRRDIYAATNSALDYLSKLSNDFNGDWLLVFAAYNTGEGNIQRSIENNKRINKPTHFWALKVHSETREYVPRLLALCHVIQNAEKFGINLPKVDNKPHVQMVNIGRQISLDLAAQLAGMSLFELKQYNPGYTSWATAPNGPHTLMLPRGSAEKFALNLAALPPGHNFGIDEHRYQKPMMLAENKNSKKTPSKLATPKTYIVKAGDNLWSIGHKYKIPTQELAAINELSTKQPLKVGQRLVLTRTPTTTQIAKNSSNIKTPKKEITAKNNIIPNANTNKPIVVAQKDLASKITDIKVYSVKQGDSIYKIAKQFGISQSELFKWNKINQKTKLKIGQKIRIAEQ